MNLKASLISVAVFAISLVCIQGSERAASRQTGSDRVVVTYWEKWTGDEMQVMKRIVDRFNRSQGKDLYGNPMADGTTLAGLALTVNTGGFSAVGSSCTDASYFLGGVKTCKYAVLNTEGSYSYSVDMTTVNPQSAIIGTLPVKSATTAVSNAEVLAAIVKLIASINKQIAKLQKLIRKR